MGCPAGLGAPFAAPQQLGKHCWSAQGGTAGDTAQVMALCSARGSWGRCHTPGELSWELALGDNSVAVSQRVSAELWVCC